MLTSLYIHVWLTVSCCSGSHTYYSIQRFIITSRELDRGERRRNMTQHTMEDTIHMLQNRIQQDKQQLKHLQSLLYPSSTAYEASDKYYSHTKAYTDPYLASEGLHVRTNPVFQSTFDAMDTYDDHMLRRKHDPAKGATHHQTPTATERHHAMQQLFHQCRKRIGRAEKLLDRASSEVCVSCILTNQSHMV